MRNMLSIAAAAVAIAMAAGVALADETTDADTINGAFTLEGLVPDTTFDLGIDVSGIPRTPAAVHAYLTSLDAASRTTILRACQNYMTYPSSAQEQETVSFCAIAISG
jgi:hypothetical protein